MEQVPNPKEAIRAMLGRKRSGKVFGRIGRLDFSKNGQGEQSDAWKFAREMLESRSIMAKISRPFLNRRGKIKSGKLFVSEEKVDELHKHMLALHSPPGEKQPALANEKLPTLKELEQKMAKFDADMAKFKAELEKNKPESYVWGLLSFKKHF